MPQNTFNDKSAFDLVVDTPNFRHFPHLAELSISTFSASPTLQRNLSLRNFAPITDVHIISIEWIWDNAH